METNVGETQSSEEQGATVWPMCPAIGGTCLVYDVGRRMGRGSGPSHHGPAIAEERVLAIIRERA